MLPCVCSVIDHRGRQNVVRTSVTHSAAPRVPLFCSYHILRSSVIYYWTDARQHGIYLLNRPQHWELHVLLLMNSVWDLLRPRNYIEHIKGLWDGAYSLSSLSKKTRQSNHLQVSLIKAALSPQLFKGPECWSGWGFETSTSCTEAWCTTNLANHLPS